jgi:hypothetical protein
MKRFQFFLETSPRLIIAWTNRRVQEPIKSLVENSKPEEQSSENLPGPGSYDPLTPGGTGPSFTFKGRPETTEHPNTAPYRQLPTTVGEGPKYFSPALGADANKYSMVSRHDARPLAETPGPGPYDIDSTLGKGVPAYTMHSRPQDAGDGTVSPGLAAYSPGYYNWGENGHAKILERFPDKIRTIPGFASNYCIVSAVNNTHADSSATVNQHFRHAECHLIYKVKYSILGTSFVIIFIFLTKPKELLMKITQDHPETMVH